MADLRLLTVLHTFFFIIGTISCVDLTVEEVEERECYGTNNGMGYSGTTELHYQRMKQRYKGCTYVNGNLEITNLWNPQVNYDLSFLKTIRYVSGYVLIAIILTEEVPMDNLEVIRGNHTKELKGEDYSLIVALTYSDLHPERGMKRIYMPRLKEISRGKVLFTQNPKLGFVNTIDWEPILRGRYEDVILVDSPFNETVADPNDTNICPDGMRWGDEPYLCQEGNTFMMCHEDCGGRCYGEGPGECCHDTCAVGCSGPSNRECLICKDYVHDGACEGFCPDMTYPWAQACVKYDKKD